MKGILYLNFFLVTLLASGQRVVSGTIKDDQGPIVGVSVYMVGSYDGTTSGIDGSFDFETYLTGGQVLNVSYVGYETASYPLDLSRDDVSIDIHLKSSLDRLKAVTITAGAFNASDQGKKVIMKSVDIVTTAGATADISGALNTLPGTQTVGETGRLFVRGGDGRETRTFIDGMMVHNEYSPSAPNSPNRHRFSPFIFKGTSFSTGGYSAEYGQAMSSALILSTKDVAEMERTDFSLMSVGVEAARTEVWSNSSFSGKIGYTNLSPYFSLASQRIQWDKAPEEWSGNFAYRTRLRSAGQLKVFGNMSRAHLKLYDTDIARPQAVIPVGLENTYGHMNVVYQNAAHEKWGHKVGFSVTRGTNEAYRGSGKINARNDGSHLKAVVYHTPNDRLSFQAGTEYTRLEIERQWEDRNVPGPLMSLGEGILSAHLESEIYVTENFVGRIGGRWEFNDLSGRNTLVPRVSLARKLGTDGQFAVAYGIFYQSPDEEILLTNRTLSSERADHYIANYQWVKANRTFRIEAYHKDYKDLAKGTAPDGFTNSGFGYSRGVDVWWRDADTFEGLDYWISYSFLDTERNYLNFPGVHTPSFASTHNVSVVMKKWISSLKSQVGVTYTFSSPRRYTDPNQDGFLQRTTPGFHDLSVNISYLMNPQVIIHAMVNNVIGFDNVYGYEYASEPDNMGVFVGRAMGPPAKRFAFLGVFITLSKNKTINQLPNL